MDPPPSLPTAGSHAGGDCAPAPPLEPAESSPSSGIAGNSPKEAVSDGLITYSTRIRLPMMISSGCLKPLNYDLILIRNKIFMHFGGKVVRIPW